MGVPPNPGVSMTDAEGGIGLPRFKSGCQLLVQAKQVALAVGARPNEPRHGPLCMSLHPTPQSSWLCVITLLIIVYKFGASRYQC